MNWWPFSLPLPLVLAAFATLGYLFGRHTKTEANEAVLRSRREQRRAQIVATELEKIASELRESLAQHHTVLLRFKERVRRMGGPDQQADWQDLCREAEEILRPTLRLAAQIANANEEIRQQSANLMTFTEVRTDPLTGVNNRRGMVDTLYTQFAMRNRYATRFAVAMFDIDHFKKVNDVEGHLHGDHVLQGLARLLDDLARETDVVTRYGGEEFVIIMPETGLQGACIFAERVRTAVATQMQITLSCGVAESLDGDTQDSLLVRADQALYEAKASGRNAVFRHNGDCTERVESEVSATPV